MSGTSIDGVDVALVETDGLAKIKQLAFLSIPYRPGFANRIRTILGRTVLDPEIQDIEREITMLHFRAVSRLLTNAKLNPKDISTIGFHGHTIHHEPMSGFTWQIGDGALLAKLCMVDVVSDFRTADMVNGGEGAPLTPIFHAALMAPHKKPLAVLNLGGIGNVTWIGKDGSLTAFDTGPANALLNDWVCRHTGRPMDKNGELANYGNVDAKVLKHLLRNPYFNKSPPKSLDRNCFDLTGVEGLLLEDGAATLTAFTVACVKAAIVHFGAAPIRWIVCGGGRLNPAIMTGLYRELFVPVQAIEEFGWDGDAIEAQAFAYMAVRRLLNLPTSFPSTTGTLSPTCGGVVHGYLG